MTEPGRTDLDVWADPAFHYLGVWSVRNHQKRKRKNCYPASCLPAGPQKQSYRPRPGLVCDFPTFNQFLEFGRESKPTVSEGTEHLSSVRRRVTMSRSNVGRYRGILQEEDFYHVRFSTEHRHVYIFSPFPSYSPLILMADAHSILISQQAAFQGDPIHVSHGEEVYPVAQSRSSLLLEELEKTPSGWSSR